MRSDALPMWTEASRLRLQNRLLHDLLEHLLYVYIWPRLGRIPPWIEDRMREIDEAE